MKTCWIGSAAVTTQRQLCQSGYMARAETGRPMQNQQQQSPSEQPFVGVLVRVSTKKQGERGASPETQRADCTIYAEREGWTVALVEEDHETGTDFDRGGY